MSAANARRRPQIPILSMLDLLFGVFGAMIVLASLLTFLRQMEARIDQIPFILVEVHLSSNDVNLDNLFVEFILESANETQIWSPRINRQPDRGSEYLASSGGNAVSASLFLPVSFLSKGSEARLRAQIQNLPYLQGEDSDEVSVTMTLKTAHNGCGVTKTLTRGELLESETEDWVNPPSIFTMFANSNNIICTASGPETGIKFEVNNDGWISLNYTP